MDLLFPITPSLVYPAVTTEKTFRFGATGGKVNNSFVSSLNYYNSRTPHVMRGGGSKLKIVLTNWYSDYAGEHLAGGDVTYTASIEYPAGTFTQAQFSGATSGTAANGDTLVSDEINVSIPDGATFWVRVFGDCPNGSVFFNGGHPTGTVPYIGDQDTAFGSACNYSSTALSDLTMGGTITNTYAPVAIYPAAVLVESSNSAVLIIGDSISQGACDSFDGVEHANGYLERSIGDYYGFSNMGCYGERGYTFTVAGTRRAALQEYATHVVCEYGVNDINAGGFTGPQVISNLRDIAAIFPNKVRIQCTLTSFTSSTDSWATLANQTPNSGYEVDGHRDKVNIAIRANNVDMDGHIDLVGGAFDGVKWKVDGTADKYTNDGGHPKTFAAKAMAALFNQNSIADGQITFDPSDLSPLAWYDASDSSTIAHVSNRVSQWYDKSGNDLHLTQSTASLQPLYKPADNAIYFTLADFFEQQATSLVGRPDYTVFIVTSNTVADWDTFFSTESIQSVTHLSRWASRATSFTRNDSKHVRTVEGYTDGANYTIKDYINNVEVDSASSDNPTNLPALSVNGKYRIGKDLAGIGGTDAFDGDIHEIIIFDKKLTDAEKLQVYSYIANKTGV